ncbi:MAG TPA: AI-2E family transporter [Solirubrobacteraceae bacterium]
MNEDRVVSFKPRTILTSAAVLLGLGVVILVVWVARHALTWVLISLFLALALNPAVEMLQRRGFERRGAAVAAIYVFALLVVVGITALLVPTLVEQTGDLADAAPGYVNDFTHGRGPLGFLETKYHLSDRVRDAIHEQSGGGGGKNAAHTALTVTRGIATGLAGVVTIIFMTLFMLLEGPSWTDRFYALLPPQSRPRWQRVGHDVYRTIGGYVSGNLLISVIAGFATSVVLLILGVPYALALGLVVAVLDLIPLAGATLAALIVTLVAFLDSTTAGIIVGVFFLVYQQLENHVLQPVVYGRTVELSALAVLISILIGVEVAGILGALMAIPIAGSIQVVLRDWLAHRPHAQAASADAPPGAASAAPSAPAP